MTDTATCTTGPLVGLAPGPAPGPAQPLPVSKLRGLTLPVRAALKRHRVTTCGQLLRAAGGARDRDRLAREAGIDPDVLLALVRQADLARVDGLGTVFGLMLEDLGVCDVPAPAPPDPTWLGARPPPDHSEGRPPPPPPPPPGGGGGGG